MYEASWNWHNWKQVEKFCLIVRALKIFCGAFFLLEKHHCLFLGNVQLLLPGICSHCADNDEVLQWTRWGSMARLIIFIKYHILIWSFLRGKNHKTCFKKLLCCLEWGEDNLQWWIALQCGQSRVKFWVLKFNLFSTKATNVSIGSLISSLLLSPLCIKRIFQVVHDRLWWCFQMRVILIFSQKWEKAAV